VIYQTYCFYSEVHIEAAGGSGDFDDEGQQLRSTTPHNKLKSVCLSDPGYGDLYKLFLLIKMRINKDVLCCPRSETPEAGARGL